MWPLMILHTKSRMTPQCPLWIAALNSYVRFTPQKRTFMGARDLSGKGPEADKGHSAKNQARHKEKSRASSRLLAVQWLQQAHIVARSVGRISRLKDINIAKASRYRPRRRHHGANCCIVLVGRRRVQDKAHRSQARSDLTLLRAATPSETLPRVPSNPIVLAVTALRECRTMGQCHNCDLPHTMMRNG
jgi:hypothetical protein